MGFINLIWLVSYPHEQDLAIDEIDEQLNETERLLGQPALGETTIITYEALKDNAR